jgi:hypothetical protein
MKLDHPIVPLLGRFLITYIFHLRYQRNRGLMTREVPKNLA